MESDSRRVFLRTGLAMTVMVAVTVGLQFASSLIFGEAVDNEWLTYALSVLPLYFIAMPLAGLIMRKTPVQPIAPKKLKTGQFMIVIMICFAIMYAGNLIGALINLMIQLLARITSYNVCYTKLLRAKR